MKEINGVLDGKSKSIAIVAGRFNSLFTDKLVEGAIDCLTRHNVSLNDIAVVKVPGAFEIPLAAKKLTQRAAYDAVLCLGAVVRGATPHFEYVSSEVSKGVAMASFESETPVIFGVITCDSLEQAIERSGTKSGNKGWDAAMAALEMISVLEGIESL